MKKIIIASVVAAIIFFAFQAALWMGGFHSDFSSYTSNQQAILDALSSNLPADGFYMMPLPDPAAPNSKEQEEKMMKERVGKPWAMINYHRAMSDFNPSYMLLGLLYSFIAGLVAALVIWYGNFTTLMSRFLVAMSFSVFVLAQGVLDDMNWFSYPWNFVKAEVIDLTLGWGLTSLWLAWFLRKTIITNRS